jgi:hypothetical protein
MKYDNIKRIAAVDKGFGKIPFIENEIRQKNTGLEKC